MGDDRFRRSPSVERILHHRPMFSRPPVRNINSPQLTEDEVDDLTSPLLTYRTGFTYAFSKSYNPDLPDSWEVPNILSGSQLRFSPSSKVRAVDMAAPSLLRRFYEWCQYTIYTSLFYFAWMVKSIFVDGPLYAVNRTSSFLMWIWQQLCFFTSAVVYSTTSAVSSVFSFLFGENARRKVANFLSVIARFIIATMRYAIYPIEYVLIKSVDAFLFTQAAFGKLFQTRRVSIDDDERVATFNINDTPRSIRRNLDDDDGEEYGTAYANQKSTMRRRRNLYDLRNRLITADASSEEDEGFSEVRPQAFRPIRTTPHLPRSSIMRKRNTSTSSSMSSQMTVLSKATIIATWLGNVASRVVYGFYWMLLNTAILISRCYDAVLTGVWWVKNEISNLLPFGHKTAIVESRATVKETSAVTTGRRTTRSQTKVAELNNEEIHVPHFASRFVGFMMNMFYAFVNLLYLIAKPVLLVMFALVDLVRWIRRSTAAVAVFVFEKIYNGLSYVGLKTKESVHRPSHLWWFLPLLLLLLFLIFLPRTQEEHSVILGQNVTEVKTVVMEYASDTWSTLSGYVGSVGFGKQLSTAQESVGVYWAQGRTATYNGYEWVRGWILAGLSYVWSLLTYVWSLIVAAWNWITWSVWYVYESIMEFLAFLPLRIKEYSRWLWQYLPPVGIYTRKAFRTLYFIPGYVVDQSNALYLMMPSFSDVKSTVYYYWPVLPVSIAKETIIREGVPQPIVLPQKTKEVHIIKEQISPEVLEQITNVIAAKVLAQVDARLSADRKESEAKGAFLSSGLSEEIMAKVLSQVDAKLKAEKASASSNKSELDAITKQITAKILSDVDAKFLAHTTSNKPPTSEEIAKVVTAKVLAEVYAKMNANKSAEPKQPGVDEITKIVSENVLAQVAAKISLEKSTQVNEANIAAAVNFDSAYFEQLIRAELQKYDADKTGLFDYALESAGAAVISTRCTESYSTFSRLEKIWNIPLWYSSYGPRVVIQRNAPTLFPGECWSFATGTGYLTISLSHPINATMFSYEHISESQAPDGNRSSAPKTMKLWAYIDENDIANRVLLGNYEYTLSGPPLQYFHIKVQPDFPVKVVELEVTSNHGSEYTCLYRLRVHGGLYKTG